MNSRTRIAVYVALLALVGGGVYAYPAVAMWWRVQLLPPVADRDVTYAADVQPILEAHCYECHGDEHRKGGLNLDDRDMLMRGGKTGPVIEDGNSAGSGLIHRVGDVAGEGPMPPSTKLQLTPEEIGVLRAWIDQGLQWEVSE